MYDSLHLKSVNPHSNYNPPLDKKREFVIDCSLRSLKKITFKRHIPQGL